MTELRDATALPWSEVGRPLEEVIMLRPLAVVTYNIMRCILVMCELKLRMNWSTKKGLKRPSYALYERSHVSDKTIFVNQTVFSCHSFLVQPKLPRQLITSFDIDPWKTEAVSRLGSLQCLKSVGKSVFLQNELLEKSGWIQSSFWLLINTLIDI